MFIYRDVPLYSYYSMDWECQYYEGQNIYNAIIMISFKIYSVCMWFEVYSGKLCYIWTIMMAVKDSPISSFIPYSHNNETHSNCQRVSVTSVTTVTAVISTHVQKITITWVLILRTVPCNQDTSQKHTPSNHSLSGLPFTFLNQAWPYCYLPVCFLTIVVPVISTVPAVPRDPCLPTEGLFPPASPSGSPQAVFHSPNISFCLQ